jgi:hypothetical protein
MATEEKGGILKDHEKFWSFILLLMAIVGLSLIATSLGSAKDSPAEDIVFAAKLRIMDIAIGGLLTIAGMAAQTALEAARKLPTPEAQDVRVINKKDDAVPTTDEKDSNDGELPPEQKL